MMRYDQTIIFNTGDKLKKYDTLTGTYQDGYPETVEKKCHVSDMSSVETVRLFGRSNVKGLIVYHKGKLVDAHSASIKQVDPPHGVVQNGERTFNIIQKRQLRHKATYVLSEDLT